MVLVLLGPADGDRAVAVQPRVGCLNDPTPGALGRVADLVSDLLPAGADMRLQAPRDRELPDLVIVVAAVQAQPLELLVARDRARDRSRLKRLLQELHVVAIGALMREPDRDARSLGKDRALRPLLALPMGFGPVLGPPRVALVIAPAVAKNDQSIPTTSSYSKSP